MGQRREIAGLGVDAELYDFIAEEVLPGTGCTTEAFFGGLAEAVTDLAPRNRELLDTRARLQAAIDEWHEADPGLPDPATYRRLLEDIGYLVPSGDAFTISTAGVDAEIALINGPQLVVPVTNARYALNAVNARWGSLYDALYGTDALGDGPPPGPYDPERGSRVIAWVRDFLDVVAPLDAGSHTDAVRYVIDDGRLLVELADGTRAGLLSGDGFAGYTGPAGTPSSVFLRNHGLLVEIVIDRTDPVGATDAAGVRDVALEAAITAIMDFEDSVATVDAQDKVAAYRNWLGLMNATLAASVEKAGASFVRRIEPDRAFIDADGTERRLRAVVAAGPDGGPPHDDTRRRRRSG